MIRRGRAAEGEQNLGRPDDQDEGDQGGGEGERIHLRNPGCGDRLHVAGEDELTVPPQPEEPDQLDALVAHATTPLRMLMLALAAVHAARPTALRTSASASAPRCTAPRPPEPSAKHRLNNGPTRLSLSRGSGGHDCCPHRGRRPLDGAVDPRCRARAQACGATEDHTPSHCSAPYASNRSSSLNPSFAASRIERALAVWV